MTKQHNKIETYDRAVEILRKHQGHGAELTCLLASDAALGRSSPPEELAASAEAFLFDRATHLQRLDYGEEAIDEVRAALNWFGQFTYAHKQEQTPPRL